MRWLSRFGAEGMEYARSFEADRNRRRADKVGSVLERWNLRGRQVFLGAVFVLPFLLTTGQFSPSDTDFAVRLINARSGKPLKGATITVSAWNGEWKYDPKKASTKRTIINVTTDAEGRALFHLPQPLPEHIGFLPVPPDDFAGCCCRQNFSPEAVRHSGAVADYDQSKCGELKSKAVPMPGQIIIFEKKLGAWEKMRREIP